MIDPIAFELGSLEVRWYGVIISFALFLGVTLSLREAKKQGIDEDFMLDLYIRVIPAAIIGARLYYVIFSWEHYSNNPMMIFSIRSGGLAIHGGVIGGLLAVVLYVRKHKKSIWKIADIVAPYLILGQAIGRWGNFINQEAHGGTVSENFMNIFPGFIKKQMYINGQYYHPTFLYESIWNFIVFLILIFIRRKRFIKNGDVFILYGIGYSIGRFFIEGMRTDSLMMGPIRVAQMVSLVLILTGIIFIYKRHRKS
ncbi:MAG: prolipoprotein diacylglyceryl transferase [Halanaerobiaceae bacterium]